MVQGKTICQCGRDDIHSSKDCWTVENWIKNSRNMTKEEADGLDEFVWKELKDNRIDSLNELTKQAQELDMGYDGCMCKELDCIYCNGLNQLEDDED